MDHSRKPYVQPMHYSTLFKGNRYLNNCKDCPYSKISLNRAEDKEVSLNTRQQHSI